jgi:hypothetical protein
MPETPARLRLSSVLLAAFGILLVGIGIYFLVLRPPLLPEDIRYMSLTPAELESVGPRLTSWVTQVFRVMGGYVAATGTLALTLAMTTLRDHPVLAGVGAGIGRRALDRMDDGGQLHDPFGLQMGPVRRGACLGREHRILNL